MSSVGILFILSAPSGTGKSTVARRLVEADADLHFSVSYTTRPRRRGECAGEHYHFVDDSEFESMARGDAFLESASVFGHSYGTGVKATRRMLGQGCDVLLDIDVQGARQVRESEIPSVSIMLLPPDFETLQGRLTDRGSESPGQLTRRLAQARREVGDYHLFDYLVVNRDLDRTVRDVEGIVCAERRKSIHSAEQAKQILATFPS